MSTAYAPGKAILFGEHAVVYGQPAIAVPIGKVRACAVVSQARGGTGIVLSAPDLKRTYPLSQAAPDDPLRAIVSNTLAHLGVTGHPDLTVTVTSTIPIARGMGSGTAISVSIVRALAAHFGATLSDAEVSALTFEAEKIYHGTPSGVDNTVVTYQKPVYFVKGQLVETLTVKTPFLLIVADTGIASPTHVAVGDVGRKWQCDREECEAIFDRIGAIARAARQAIELGQPAELGPLMNDNQALLQSLGVSSPELDRLIEVAVGAGAAGAKLSGAGRGGNIIALAPGTSVSAVEKSLLAAGAKGVIVNEVS